MKAFKIKNGLQASRYLLSSTTISGSTIDLSLGSMFSTTLSSDPAYTFTNPPASGVAQAFSLEVAGGTTNYVQDSFATTLYSGTGSAQTITNGLNLSTDGGLVWIKWRSGTLGSAPHVLVDTVRGVNKNLKTSSADAENSTSSVDSFTSTGFTLAASAGPNGGTNYSGTSQVAWTFKKQAKFFDIQTWTGDGASSRNISHNLGVIPGMIIVKWYNEASQNWTVYHRGFNGGTDPEDYGAYLNTTAAPINESSFWYDTAPTSTNFTIGNSINSTYGGGGKYIAYIFAHDTASDSRVKCGSYSPSGSAFDVTLGWEPQWLLIRDAAGGDNWVVVDSVRGVVTGGTDKALKPNSDAAETDYDYVDFTSTGFKATSATTYGSGKTMIYMAIRKSTATDSAITWPTSIKWPAGVAPTTPASGKKDLFTFLTTDGGTTYYGKKAAKGIA